MNNEIKIISQINVKAYLYLSSPLVLLKYLIQAIIKFYLDYFCGSLILSISSFLPHSVSSHQMIFLKLKSIYVIPLLESLPTVLRKILNYLKSFYIWSHFWLPPWPHFLSTLSLTHGLIITGLFLEMHHNFSWLINTSQAKPSPCNFLLTSFPSLATSPICPTPNSLPQPCLSYFHSSNFRFRLIWGYFFPFFKSTLYFIIIEFNIRTFNFLFGCLFFLLNCKQLEDKTVLAVCAVSILYSVWHILGIE